MAEIGEKYAAAFMPESSSEAPASAEVFTVVAAGLLNLPSGQIVVCDPLTGGQRAPFVQSAKPGRYPVELALLRTADGAEYVALSRIKFSDSQPAVWVMALRKGQDPRKLEAGGYFGFRSESGTAAYLDADSLPQANFEQTEDIDALLTALTANYARSRYWMEYPLDRRLGVVMFSSGKGPGFYASYFGIDEEGDVSALVTDFNLLY